MYGDSTKGSRRMLNVGDQCPEATQALFFTHHLVLAVWQWNRVNIRHGVTGIERQPVNGVGILTFNKLLDTTSLLQRNINGCESEIHLERISQFFRDEAISAPSHAVIQFG